MEEMFFGQKEANDAEEESDEVEGPKPKSLSAILNVVKVNSSKNANKIDTHDKDEDNSDIVVDLSDLEDEEGKDEIDSVKTLKSIQGQVMALFNKIPSFKRKHQNSRFRK